MISSLTIGTMFVPVIVPFLLFGFLIFYYKKKVGISIKPLLLGALGFIVFTQILEKALHLFVITNFPNYMEHPFIFGIYGGLAAGVFEEVGRFVLFIWLLKAYRKYKDGISFGIGWGGIEGVLLGCLAVIPTIIFAFMINNGIFESEIIAKAPPEQAAALMEMKEKILRDGPIYYLIFALERIFAVFIQIALSLIVLLGVVKKTFLYVLYAILIHAAIDFPAALYQGGVIKELWMIELMIFIFAILAIFYIQKAKPFFND